jgi:hypothetical protein
MLHDRGKWFYSVNSFGIGCFLSGALVMWLPAGLSRNCLHNWLLRIVGALTAPHSYGTDVPVDGAVQSINSGQLPDKQPPLPQGNSPPINFGFQVVAMGRRLCMARCCCSC